MTDKLLPCPFCGGKADYCETNAWWVQCNECNAETDADMSPEAAAEIWNRRTPPPSTHLMGQPGSPSARAENSADAGASAFDPVLTQAPAQHLRGIETAPKDGTWFIAYQDSEPFPCDWRTEEQDEGPPREGWFDFFNRSFEEPTHWLPVVGATPEGK